MYTTQFASFKRPSLYNCGRFPLCHLPPQTLVQANKKILYIFFEFTLSNLQRAKLGFCWQFITLAGFHCDALSIDLFAKAMMGGFPTVATVRSFLSDGDDGDDGDECARNMPPAALMPMCP